MWKKSIFNNITINGNFAYIHFPLIFKTNNILYTEMYTRAVIAFLELIEIKKNIYNKIIDFLVVELLCNQVNIIHNQAYIKFQNPDFLKKTKRKLDSVYKKIPVLIEEIENYILKKQKIPSCLFKKISKMFVYLLAVNNLSFIVETFLPAYLQNSPNKDTELEYITKDIFSHIKYYSSAKEELFKGITKDKLFYFLRNIAFLENELGDKTSFEELNYIKELLNKDKLSSELTSRDIITSDFASPDIKAIINRNDYDKYPLIIIWAKILQINLEFRHYWLLRFLRDLRIYCDYDYKIINNWTLKDYEEQNIEIK